MKTIHYLLARLTLILTFFAAALALVAPTPRAFGAPGDLDPTFGTGGAVTTPFSGNAYGQCIALQPDGKVLVAGVVGNETTVLARYTDTGALDATFGTGGTVMTDVSSGYEAIRELAVLADGKILAAGYARVGTVYCFALQRYTDTGALDPTFGTGGVVVTQMGPGAIANGMAVQSDGRIILAGHRSESGTNHIALARYTDTGALDATFGTGGTVVTPIGIQSDASRVRVQADGKIVAAGTWNPGGESQVAVVRYADTGALDASFGSGGIAAITLERPYCYVTGLEVQPNGRILVGGAFQDLSDTDFLLVRFTGAGALDPSLGGDGVVTTSFDTYAFAEGMALLPNGRIVLAGTTGSSFALAQYSPSGTLIPGFGTGGKALAAPYIDNRASGVAVQADGKFVVGGTAYTGTGDLTAARFEGGPVSGPVEHTVIYSKGGIVPGAGSDPRIPAGALFTQFFPPAINEEGKVAFVAKWKAGTVSSGGVFVDGALVAALGEATSISGTIWKTFKDPVIGRTGKVAFLATIGGASVTTVNDSVVATNLSGSLEIVAREQAVAAGTSGALWKTFLGVSLAPRFSGGGVLPEPDEELLFKGTLFVGGGVPVTDLTNDSAVWSYDSASLTVSIALREGVTQMSDGALSQVFGAPVVKTFSLFTALSGSPGQGGQHVSLAGGATAMKWTSAAGLQALTTADGRLNSYIVGQYLGGTTIPDALFLGLNPPCVGRWESAVGQPLVAAVRAKLIAGTTGVTTTTSNGIFASTDSYQNWEPVARQGHAATGTNGLFKTFKDPVLASNHRGLAFSGAASGGTVTLADDTAIWWQPDGGTLTLVAREGASPIGAPAGAKWKAFDSLALPGGATGPLFTATLLQGPGGITALDDAALYGVDSLGALRELMRENQPLLGKTVKTFLVLKTATGSPGVARSFNSAGEVVSLVTFTDTTTAIVKILVP